MPSLVLFLLVLIVVLCLLTPGAYAFGAGDIPDFAYLNDKAFRHGDIENVLGDIVKAAAHGHGGGSGLLGFAKQIIDTASGGKKFSKDDIKKVYFGNWLRDYSQAMDIAGLSKLTAESLVLVVSVLGFLEFGFATEEFDVTADRLGVYLPVEHIDNPKGYGAKEGDPRQFHPKLRPPVEDRELEIDERTGMKKYMATENEGWDTSTAYIRRSLRWSIENGRRGRGGENADTYEAYRTLGQALHTLEDLLAHSNWCEIALIKMGHRNVFPHVGDNVRINTPNGEAPPLITGTFGSADFFHSLLGETADHLSQSSVTDLSKTLDDAKNSNADDKLGVIREILGKIMGGGGEDEDKMQQADEMKKKSEAYDFNPDDIAPPEVQKQLLDLLRWRDDIYRQVLKKLEMIPGLTDLLDNLTDALNAYVYTLLAPYLTPILQQVTTVVGEGSKAVIDSDDQYEVFNDPDAHDPSHSLLSKDHFSLILNEPAGKIAQVVVRHAVNLVVEAWGNDDADIDRTIEQVLEAFHHPYYATGNSQVQHDMMQALDQWLGGLGSDEREQVLQKLTKDSVREGHNKRFSQEQEEEVASAGRGGGQGRTGGGYQHQQSHNQGGNSIDSEGYGGRSEDRSSGYGHSEGRSEGYDGRSEGYGSRPSESYSGRSEGYGGRSEASYGGRSEGRSGGYVGESEGYGGRSERSDDYRGRPEEYGSERRHGEYNSGGGYSSSQNQSSGEYGRSEREEYGGSGGYRSEDRYSGGYGGESGGYGSERRHESSYNSADNSYGRSEEYGENRHHGRRHDDDENSGGYNPSYGESREECTNYGESGYGGNASYSGGNSIGGGRSGHRGSDSGYGDNSGSGYVRGEESAFTRTEGYGDTFGAERLSLNEGGYGQSEEHHGRRRHHESGY